jgi:hypothetical protein
VTHLDITVHHMVCVQILETLRNRLRVNMRRDNRTKYAEDPSYHNGVIHNVAELVLVEGGGLS